MDISNTTQTKRIGIVVIHLAGLCCPRCHYALKQLNTSKIVCCNAECLYHEKSFFPVVSDQPALIDFEKSVIRRESLIAHHGESVITRKRPWIYDVLRLVLRGESAKTDDNAKLFMTHLLQTELSSTGETEETVVPRNVPVVLMVGGGTVRSGARLLYGRDDLKVLSFDVYASPITDFVGDGHQIALPDNSVEGVWIEAVLEHVLEPHIVAAEIHRVLKPGGLVYAETPFMQQVHEAAYDFTRFTHSGHRWLFRNFTEVTSGAITGPGTALIWSSRYFWQALTGNRTIGIFSTLPIFWLRFFDRFMTKKGRIDAACGVFFMGRKATQPISYSDIIKYYRGGGR